MKTEKLLSSIPADINRAGELLISGQLVAVPTETVYGLAADASNPNAVANIFIAKQRPKNHPLITHIGHIDHLSRWVKSIPEWVYPLVNAFWPGPLTFIFERHPDVSDVITGGLDTIGIRMPNHPVLLSLLQQFDIAVAAPSANPYQKLSPTSAAQVLKGLSGKIAGVLDAGECQLGTESTILKVGNHKAEILRSGPLSKEQLQPYLPIEIKTPKIHNQKVSGNKKVHYQPNAKVIICPKNEIEAALDTHSDNTGFLSLSSIQPKSLCSIAIQMPNNHQGYRQALYSSLHQLDDLGVTTIIVEAPPQLEPWADIWDRLSRAAAK
ncbi:L-threonylcarbamoyladenylate synthase [Thalassotalea ganghwensis]